MGYRLTKIYTKTGDNGQTGLGDGSRTAKNSARIEAIGTVDELNSAIGILVCLVNAEIRPLLLAIQNDLFDLGGELSLPKQQIIHDQYVARLEQHIDHYNEKLPPLKNFILPGGSLSNAHAHLARTICRRAERTLVTLTTQEDVNKHSVHYLNRLSDLLFVLCRTLLVQEGIPEVLWQPPAKPIDKHDDKQS